MSVAVPTFPTGEFEIDLGSSNETTFTVLQNAFGDGYIQRAADGLNSNRDSWDASWTNLTDAEAQLIYGFLRERSGYKPFYYQAPGDSVIKQWTARSVNRQPMAVSGDRGYWKISCTLKEEFGATIEVKTLQMLLGVVGTTHVGTMVGNSPTILLIGVNATGSVGRISVSKVKIVGASATGSAGIILGSSTHLVGVEALGIGGTVTT